MDKNLDYNKMFEEKEWEQLSKENQKKYLSQLVEDIFLIENNDDALKVKILSLLNFWINIPEKNQSEHINDIVYKILTYPDNNTRALVLTNFFNNTSNTVVKKYITDILHKSHPTNISHIWSSLTQEQQEANVCDAIKFFSTFTDESGKITPQKTDIQSIWFFTHPYIQSKYLEDIMKSVTTYIDENDNEQPNTLALVNIWCSSRDSVKKQNLHKILALLSKNGKAYFYKKAIAENFKNSYQYLNADSLIEFVKNISTYIDESGNTHINLPFLREIFYKYDECIMQECFPHIYRDLMINSDIDLKSKQDIAKVLMINLPPIEAIDSKQLEKINTNYDIPIKVSLKTLKSFEKKIDKRVPIVLVIKDASELSIEDIDV